MENEGYWARLQCSRFGRRRALAAVTAAGAGITAAGLLGCGTRQSGTSTAQPSRGSASAGTPQSGGILNATVTYNPPLDPQKVSAAAQQGIAGVMSRIFRFQTSATDPNESANHDLEGDLGVSAESPDAVTWTIKLRPDAHFTDIAPVNGHAVEAEDVQATFKRALDPSIPNPNRGSLDMIDPAQIQTPDKQTVVFKLKFQYSPFRQLLASPAYSWIFPREALAGTYDPSKTAIGSGPFMLDTVTPDVAYTYKKNPNWFEKGRPYIDGYKLAVIGDHSTLLAQFIAGNLDEILPQVADIDALRSQAPKATIQTVIAGSPEPVYFQMGDPTCVFQDIRMRRAVSMAIDRDAIGKAIYQGKPENLVFVPATVGKWALHIEQLPADVQQYYKYNPSEAKKLIDAAGATGQSFRLIYINPGPFSTPQYIKQAETVASMVNAVGLKVTLGQHDYNKDFVDAGKGSRQGYFDKDVLLFGASAGFSDADDWLFSYLDSQSTSNQEHLKDPDYDAMMTKERAATNEADRLKQVLVIQQYIADRMYAPSTGAGDGWFAINPRVQNYQYASSIGKPAECYAKLWLKT